MHTQRWISFGGVLLVSASSQAMMLLDDESMASVTGQSGLVVDTQSLGVTAGRVSFIEDGQELYLEGVAVQPVDGQSTMNTVSTVQIDVDGRLQLEIAAAARRFAINEIKMAGSPHSFGRVFGQYRYDSKLHIKGTNDGRFDLSGSELDLQVDRLFWRDNGLDWIIDDLRTFVGLDHAIMSFDDNRLNLDLGTEQNRGLRLIYQVGGVGLDATHVSQGELGLNTPLFDSFGDLYLNLQAYGSVGLEAGGASGEGLTFLPALTLINDDDATPAFRYTDDGNLLLARNFSGTYTSQAGFTLDLASDVAGPYMDIRFADFDFAFNLEDLVLGGTNPNANTIGSLGGEFHFRNDPINQRFNYIQLRPGGDVGIQSKGITADVSWNLVSDPYDSSEGFARPGQMNTFVSVIDDGNYVLFNGFNSHGSGRVTLDMTSMNDPIVGNAGTRSVFASDYDGHFDGLRMGFKDIRGAYSFSGVTVGRSEAEARESALMGGTELLLSLEVFPAYDFVLNGHMTIRPGNVIGGGQGITWNTDLFVTEANAALTVDENGKGVWLTNASYDMHTRDGSLNITEDGLRLGKGLTWSTLNIGDIKFGDKETGASLGSFTLQRLEDGSSVSVASGGAGQVCIGGSGSDASSCAASGGRFEDRGEQGLTVKVNAKFVQAGSTDPRYAGKANRFTWTQANGTSVSLDNFSTSDGLAANPTSNEYGMNADLAIDVAPTRVLDQAGMPVQVDGQDPLGFAVLGRVHFKQLNIDNLTLTGSGANASPQTLVSGLVIQNANIVTNLTATPIR